MFRRLWAHHVCRDGAAANIEVPEFNDKGWAGSDVRTGPHHLKQNMVQFSPHDNPFGAPVWLPAGVRGVTARIEAEAHDIAILWSPGPC